MGAPVDLCHKISMAQDHVIFDRQSIRRNRDRAAANFAAYDFLFQEVGGALADRLDDITREFPLALDLGCRTGGMAALLAGRGGIRTLVHSDISEAMTRVAPIPHVVADEEFLPFGPGSLDLVVSCLSLHTVNDLPGALVQIRQALKPDGLFLATMFGGETLGELRAALLTSEAENESGASPRVAPFIDIRDAGDLLQRAGFALPVVDTERLTVSYENPLKLMRDLRGMGEANALVARRRGFTRRATMMGAWQHYLSAYGDDQGRVPATFEIVSLTAWAPDASQQQPLQPGSATQRLADALDGEEISAGDPAKPRL